MKKIICLILTVTMLMSMSLFLFSCNDGEDNNDDTNKETKVTYTVTVKDADGKAIKGAVITFSPKGSNPVPYLTDKDGEATFTTDKERYLKIANAYLDKDRRRKEAETPEIS